MGRLRGDDRGVTTIQVTILMPAVLMWIFLSVQYGLWWHAKQVANQAAAEALDAAQTPDGGAEDGERAAREVLQQSGNLSDVVIEIERSGGEVVVLITGRAPPLVPGQPWTVSARSSGPVERFIPQGER